MTTKTKTNPPMTFGSKEWNEHYGLRHGARHKGDRAERTRKSLKASLTKKGERAHHEVLRQDWEKDGQRLAKEQQAEDRAEARILGPTGKTHALKIAKPSGTFGPEDVQTFLQSGWSVHPAGSVSARTGLALGALEPYDLALNPSPDFQKLLGPRQAARAIVLAHPQAVITADTVHRFREAGYDVAPASKALREGRAAATQPKGHLAPGADTRSRPGSEAETMKTKTAKTAKKPNPAKGTKAQPAKTAKKPNPAKGTKAQPAKASKPSPKKPAPKASKAKPSAPERPKVQPLKSPKADRYRTEKAVEALLDSVSKGKPKPKKVAPEPKGTLESATLKIRFNPGSVADVQRVWKAWTGAKPGQVLKLTVDDPDSTLPENVALLGRVSRFIEPNGGLQDFGDAGPLLVTDGQAKQVWMIHPKGFRFDLRPSVICYLAKKPKFGDQDLIEYVHAFDRPARARMAGQVGALTGGFRLTPRGIEG